MLCITRGASLGTELGDDGLEGVKYWSTLNHLMWWSSCVLIIWSTDVWVQVTPCLQLTCVAQMFCHAECHWVLTGNFNCLADNLHPIATKCDSAGVSTGFWIHRFIASHTDRVRWCISKKFTKESLKFRAGMLGFATSRAESFVFRSYWFIF